MELLKRIVISVIAIPALLFLYYYGKLPLLLFFCLLSGLAAYELYKMCRNKGIDIMISAVPLSVMATYCTAMYNLQWIGIYLFVCMILIGFEDVFKNKLEGSFSRFSAVMWIILYCGVSFGFALRIHTLPNGKYLLPVLAVLIWVTDSFAYFIGMAIGKHRGYFKASPKKSIEGFIGGFVFCLIFAVLAHYLMPDKINTPFAIIMALVVGIIGQYGDLFESIIKRHFEVKDSSNLIPGHGGVLDRFDSFILSAPVFYIILKILLEI